MIGIAASSDVGNEAEAIRQVLEYFGYTTLLFHIGRPNHLVRLLSGDLSPCTLDFLILSVHGEDGCFVLPELHESVYEMNEPRKKLGVAEVLQIASLSPKTTVINTGCGLGQSAMGEAFVRKGAKCYIGTAADIEGNAVMPFLVRFFYEIRQNGKTEREAYQIARSIDEETLLFELFETDQ